MIGTLGPGGAEGVVARLASAWATHGDTVSVVTLAEVASDFPAIAPEVARVGLGLAESTTSLTAAVRANLRRVLELRKALRAARPDLVLAFVDRTNVLTLLATVGVGLPVVVCERTDPRHHLLPQPWAALRHLLYPRATALVVQHEGLRGWAEALCGAARVLVLPNPVAVDGLGDPTPPAAAAATPETGADAASSGFAGRRSRIVGVGRLYPEKGFDRLVDAFALLADRLPDWDLVLTGDGPQRPRLEAIVRDRALGRRVQIRASRPDPWEGTRAGDVFVLPSLYEGMSNALLEAMATGLAPVVTPRGGGAHGVVLDGTNGIVAAGGRPGDLAAAITRVASDAALREALAAGARLTAARFATPQVAAQWRAALLPLAAHTDRPD